MRLTTFIYALCEPGTRTVRYIGKANNPKKRLSVHLADKRGRNHRRNWLETLVKQGLKPTLEILDEVPLEFWPHWEVAWIAFYREAGFDLVNSNAGGEGGIDPTPETRAKISVATKGRKRSAETCERIRLAKLGQIHSTEARQNMSAALCGNTRRRGKKDSPESHDIRRAAHLGKKASPEHRAAVSAGLKGKPKSQAHREKLSAASLGNTSALGKPKSDETRFKLSVQLKAWWARKKATVAETGNPS